MISDAESVFVKGAGGGRRDCRITATVSWRWKSSDLLQSWMRSLLQGDELLDLIAMNSQQTVYSFIVVQIYSISVNKYGIKSQQLNTANSVYFSIINHIFYWSIDK